jgi:hypothetical protein
MARPATASEVRDEVSTAMRAVSQARAAALAAKRTPEARLGAASKTIIEVLDGVALTDPARAAATAHLLASNVELLAAEYEGMVVADDELAAALQ